MLHSLALLPGSPSPSSDPISIDPDPSSVNPDLSSVVVVIIPFVVAFVAGAPVVVVVAVLLVIGAYGVVPITPYKKFYRDDFDIDLAWEFNPR